MNRESLISSASLSGAVLAGGHSRRMGGRDKAVFIKKDVPLWRRQVEVLRQAGCGAVGIVRRRDQPPLPLPESVPCWFDTVENAGPLAGVSAALNATTTDWLAVVAVDLAAIDARWFQWLGRHCAPDCGAVAQHADGNFEPLAAIYPSVAREAVTARLATAEFSLQALVRDLIARRQITAVPVGINDVEQLANWNTPGDAGGGESSKRKV